MTSVVVTGAAGFLGRFVVADLASRGFNVIAVSRRRLPGMHFVQDYSQSPAGDVLIHLAEEPDRRKANGLGQQYLIDASRVVATLSERRSEKMIYASSGVVYGDENEGPCTVDLPVVGTDVYSKSKVLNERIVLDGGGVVMRLSNLFGDGMATNNVLSDIIRQVPGDGPVRVRDDQVIRDFLAACDAATAFGLAVQSNYCGVMNVGSGIGTSVKTLTELILAAAGQNREIVAAERSPRRSINVLDISATTKMLGWAPSLSLKERLSQFLHSGVAS